MMEFTPVLYGSVSEIYDPESSSFYFRHAYSSNGEITEKEAEWYFSFLATLYHTAGQIHDTYDYYLGNGSEKLGYMDSYAFSDLDSITEINSTIQKIVPSADVHVINDIYAHPTQLHVSLHLAADETLPEEGLNAAQRIFESLDLSQTMYNTIIIHLTDEEENSGEHAYVKFTRNYFFSTEEEGSPSDFLQCFWCILQWSF